MAADRLATGRPVTPLPFCPCAPDRAPARSNAAATARAAAKAAAGVPASFSPRGAAAPRCPRIRSTAEDAMSSTDSSPRTRIPATAVADDMNKSSKKSPSNRTDATDHAAESTGTSRTSALTSLPPGTLQDPRPHAPSGLRPVAPPKPPNVPARPQRSMLPPFLRTSKLSTENTILSVRFALLRQAETGAHMPFAARRKRLPTGLDARRVSERSRKTAQ